MADSLAAINTIGRDAEVLPPRGGVNSDRQVD
jgi:hypothetical protein